MLIGDKNSGNSLTAFFKCCFQRKSHNENVSFLYKNKLNENMNIDHVPSTVSLLIQIH